MNNTVSVCDSQEKPSKIVSKPFFPSDGFRDWVNTKYSSSGLSDSFFGESQDIPGPGSEVSAANAAETLSRSGVSLFLINEHNSSSCYPASTYERFLVGGESDKLSERISRFEVAKKKSTQLQNFLEQFPEDLAMVSRSQKLSRCGSILLLRDYLNHNQSRLQGGMFCGQPKLCMGCAIRRSSKMLRDLVSKVTQVLWQFNMEDSLVFSRQRKPLLPYMVTFTIKNGENLSERYSHLNRAITFCSSRSRRHRSGQFSDSEWCKAHGIFLSYEFKRGLGSGLWHPHCHSVWLSQSRPDESKLRDEWLQVTGDSFMVDVTPFNSSILIESMASHGCFYADQVQDALAGDLVEVCKYCLKLTDMDPQDSWDSFNALFRCQMARKCGSLRGVVIDDCMRSVFEPELDGPFVDYVMGWNGLKSRYNVLECRASDIPKV